MSDKKYVTVTVILLVAMSAACNSLGTSSRSLTGSGNLVVVEKEFADFEKIDASNAFKIEVARSEQFSTEIRLDDNLERYLEVTKVGDTLRIGLDRDFNFSLSGVTLEATITMPLLTGIDLSGACEASITGFRSGNNLGVDLSGSSTLEGDIEADDVRLDLSGSSEVRLTGSGANLFVDASGNSRVRLGDFSVDDADLRLSGSSEAVVDASGTLDVDASGSSEVTYRGSPTMGNIDTSGSASVNRR